MRRWSVATKVLEGVARLPWAVHWGEVCVLSRKPFRDAYAEAPPTPGDYARWARKLALAIEVRNNSTVSDLYHRAHRAGYRLGPEHFGSELASMSLRRDVVSAVPLVISVPRSGQTFEWALQTSTPDDQPRIRILEG